MQSATDQALVIIRSKNKTKTALATASACSYNIKRIKLRRPLAIFASGLFLLLFVLVGDVRQKCYLSCTLDSGVDLALMLCTSTRNSSRKDLTSLRNELTQTRNVLVIDIVDMLRAEYANFLSLAVRTEAASIFIRLIHNNLFLH